MHVPNPWKFLSRPPENPLTERVWLWLGDNVTALLKRNPKTIDFEDCMTLVSAADTLHRSDATGRLCDDFGVAPRSRAENLVFDAIDEAREILVGYIELIPDPEWRTIIFDIGCGKETGELTPSDINLFTLAEYAERRFAMHGTTLDSPYRAAMRLCHDCSTSPSREGIFFSSMKAVQGIKHARRTAEGEYLMPAEFADWTSWENAMIERIAVSMARAPKENRPPVYPEGGDAPDAEEETAGALSLGDLTKMLGIKAGMSIE